MKGWHVTVIVLGVFIAGLVAWEIYTLVNDEPNDTISEVVAFFGRHPIVPFLVGVLIGHWFWPMYTE